MKHAPIKITALALAIVSVVIIRQARNSPSASTSMPESAGAKTTERRAGMAGTDPTQSQPATHEAETSEVRSEQDRASLAKLDAGLRNALALELKQAAAARPGAGNPEKIIVDILSTNQAALREQIPLLGGQIDTSFHSAEAVRVILPVARLSDVTARQDVTGVQSAQITFSSHPGMVLKQ